MLLPLLVGVSLAAKQSPSGVLMPFGLATVIGGTVTTIGTSTNLLVVSVARDLGVRPFGMFDFALPIALVGSVGIVFLWLVGPRLLPQRQLADRRRRRTACSARSSTSTKTARSPARRWPQIRSQVGGRTARARRASRRGAAGAAADPARQGRRPPARAATRRRG